MAHVVFIEEKFVRQLVERNDIQEVFFNVMDDRLRIGGIGAWQYGLVFVEQVVYIYEELDYVAVDQKLLSVQRIRGGLFQRFILPQDEIGLRIFEKHEIVFPRASVFEAGAQVDFTRCVTLKKIGRDMNVNTFIGLLQPVDRPVELGIIDDKKRAGRNVVAGILDKK